MAKGMNAEVIVNILQYLESGVPQSPVNTEALQAAGKI
jgi:hypothetical protein